MTTSTIKDVAREAGVSVGSVSRVINGLAVSDTMKRKVDAAMAKLGYQPSGLARSLRTRSTRAIGFLVTDVSNPLYGAIINAVASRLRSRGLMLMLASFGADQPQSEMEAIEEFKRRRVDGLILAPGSEVSAPLVSAIEHFGAPVAVIGGDFPSHIPAVVTDFRSGVRKATRYLLGLGHRRIALLTPLVKLWPGKERIAGFQEAFEEAGLPRDNAIVRPQWQGLDAAAEVSSLLTQEQPPTALIVLGTRILAGTLRAVREQHRSIPDDLSLISIGDSEWTLVHEPPITTLKWNAEEVAFGLVNLLLAQMEGRPPEGESSRIAVHTDLVLRESCAAPPRSEPERRE
ncbi:MAG: substrate-binding domain-containing protein [Alcanivorax sp.]|nr:substrate-binding domain-containing protein [Alcanivorax sp.]